LVSFSTSELLASSPLAVSLSLLVPSLLTVFSLLMLMLLLLILLRCCCYCYCLCYFH
jgi:hypothetical protein